MIDDYTKHVRLTNNNHKRIKFLVARNKIMGKETNITKQTNKLLDEMLSIFNYDEKEGN